MATQMPHCVEAAQGAQLRNLERFSSALQGFCFLLPTPTPTARFYQLPFQMLIQPPDHLQTTHLPRPHSSSAQLSSRG